MVTMGLTAGQRRALRKIERGIQVSDPRLASMLDMFGRLNRDEDMPLAETSVRWRGPAACRGARLGSTARYTTALVSVIACVALVSIVVLLAGSAGSARCGGRAVAGAAAHDEPVRACGPQANLSPAVTGQRSVP